MNLTLLALMLDAAMGRDRSRQLLPIAIGAGTLIKPQFALYLGLLLVLEPTRRVALLKILATGLAAAALAGFAVTLLAVCALAYVAWQRAVRRGVVVPLVSLACLAFVVLTFANPRVPLYDLYAAGIALAINLTPWLIAELARTPTAYPLWTTDLLVTHVAGLALLLLSLARTGLGPSAVRVAGRSATG